MSQKQLKTTPKPHSDSSIMYRVFPPQEPLTLDALQAQFGIDGSIVECIFKTDPGEYLVTMAANEGAISKMASPKQPGWTIIGPFEDGDVVPAARTTSAIGGGSVLSRIVGSKIARWLRGR